MSETSRGFRPAQSANEVHQALKSSLAAMEKAQRCAVLWFGDILQRQLYRELGYSSINQYAKMELGFSTSLVVAGAAEASGGRGSGSGEHGDVSDPVRAL